MSEVKRFRADHRHVVETEFDDAQYVGVKDYDAAQSELTALREELATLLDQHADQSCIFCNDSGELLSKVKSLSASLTAAEQRNAECIALLRRSTSADCQDFKQWWNDRALILQAALQPTESGASE